MDHINDPAYYDLHFGVVSNGHNLLIEDRVPSNRQTLELPTDHPAAYWWAQVDGSWQTWGTDGEPTESAHVVIAGMWSKDLTGKELRTMRDALAAITNGRVIDYALITEDGDDSKKVGLVTFDTEVTYSYGVSPGFALMV